MLCLNTDYVFIEVKTMRLVFWQNILSQHQLPYISCLLNDKRVDEVIVAAGRELDNDRRDMGWDTSLCRNHQNRMKVYVNPNEPDIKNILRERCEDSIHLFSGVRANPFVFSAIKESMKFDVKRGMITELPTTWAHGRPNGRPLWLHKIRWNIQDRRYINAIDYVFAMGEDAVRFYRSLSNNWMVFPFAYCTKDDGTLAEEKHSNDPLRFCYVGSLSPRKYVSSILSAVSGLGGGTANYLWGRIRT